jgi:hypothetical protein
MVCIIARSRKDSDLNMRVVHKMEALIFQQDQKHLEEVQFFLFFFSSLISNLLEYSPPIEPSFIMKVLGHQKCG